MKEAQVEMSVVVAGDIWVVTVLVDFLLLRPAVASVLIMPLNTFY